MWQTRMLLPLKEAGIMHGKLNFMVTLRSFLRCQHWQNDALIAIHLGHQLYKLLIWLWGMVLQWKVKVLLASLLQWKCCSSWALFWSEAVDDINWEVQTCIQSCIAAWCSSIGRRKQCCCVTLWSQVFSSSCHNLPCSGSALAFHLGIHQAHNTLQKAAWSVDYSLSEGFYWFTSMSMNLAKSLVQAVRNEVGMGNLTPAFWDLWQAARSLFKICQAVSTDEKMMLTRQRQ